MAYLSRLRLTNFRNLTHLDIELSPGVTVYYGPNAQGKTTLLEAVYLLCIAKSFRAENERELVSFEAARSGEQALVDGPQALHVNELPWFLEDMQIAREAFENRRKLSQRFGATTSPAR